MKKVIKTNSYFVNIIDNNGNKYIKRTKRKGITSYARTLSFKQINKVLLKCNILYPKLLRNHFKYVIEEYISPTEDINSASNDIIFDYFINAVRSLININIDEFISTVKWKNNSEFMIFQINNFKKAAVSRKLDINTLENKLKDVSTKMDDNRKLCFIHGDLHKNNLIINDNNFYLVDWEMATIGDLAYELAIHFILMDYSKEKQELFVNNLLNDTDINKNNLIKDVEKYKKFELIRRNILHGTTKNHYH